MKTIGVESKFNDGNDDDDDDDNCVVDSCERGGI
jgi:hypothetical protein